MTSSPVPQSAAPRSSSHKLFLGFLAVVGALYLGLIVYHFAIPQVKATGPEQSQSLLEQCRQVCQAYGLLPTGHIKNDAEEYLKAVRSKPITADLEAILHDDNLPITETQTLPLLEEQAPAFELADDGGKKRSLQEINAKGPTVVVFYLGYGCSHCVAQLVAMNKDLNYFHELGAQVVAISSDPSEHTAERFKEYGRFDFPVLSDPDNAIAQKYECYTPKTPDRPESMTHGTFVIDRTGKIIWGNQGLEPYLDNKSLLHIIARSEGRIPTPPHLLEPAAN
jgi:peroxiredoxin Q/BCP